jgi:hypothetical protein
LRRHLNMRPGERQGDGRDPVRRPAGHTRSHVRGFDLRRAGVMQWRALPLDDR